MYLKKSVFMQKVEQKRIDNIIKTALESILFILGVLVWLAVYVALSI